MLTKKELFKPRILLKSFYPHCPFEAGTIFSIDENGELYSKEFGYPWSAKKIIVGDIIKCPNIFRYLEWWEYRTEDEMPKYLKDNINRIFKADKHFFKLFPKKVYSTNSFIFDNETYFYTNFTPVTELDF